MSTEVSAIVAEMLAAQTSGRISAGALAVPGGGQRKVASLLEAAHVTSAIQLLTAVSLLGGVRSTHRFAVGSLELVPFSASSAVRPWRRRGQRWAWALDACRSPC